MTTTTRQRTRSAPALPAFRTPVRGYPYAPGAPDGEPPHPGQPGRLVPEPANPADPHAVAVWVDDDGARWRIGYLDRGVAARVAPRLAEGLRLRVRIDGWVSEPEGRWRRPVVLLVPEPDGDGSRAARPLDEAPDSHTPAHAGRDERSSPRPAVWGRPPGVARRSLGRRG